GEPPEGERSDCPMVVATAGLAKAAGFSQWSTLCGPAYLFCPGTRRALQPNPEVVELTHGTVSGWPSWSVRIQLVFQPPSTPSTSAALFARKRFPLPMGNW